MTTTEVDTRGWEFAGATSNARFFFVEPRIVAAIALAGTSDDRETALENRAYQDKLFRDRGTSGAMIVFMDGFSSQDQQARRVYQGIEGPHVIAAAMIAESILGRAIAAFAVGIQTPNIPVKIFRDFDHALPWARERVLQASGNKGT